MSSNAFDYGIDVFKSERIEDRGYFGDAGTQISPTLYRTTLVARRFGEGIFPVDVRVVFDNGQDVKWKWDGRDRWKLFEVERPVRAVSAQVDPNRVLLLDVNYTNNTRAIAPKTKDASRHWSLASATAAGSPATYGFFI
jgi:hypothetical protein